MSFPQINRVRIPTWFSSTYSFSATWAVAFHTTNSLPFSFATYRYILLLSRYTVENYVNHPTLFPALSNTFFPCLTYHSYPDFTASLHSSSPHILWVHSISCLVLNGSHASSLTLRFALVIVHNHFISGSLFRFLNFAPYSIVAQFAFRQSSNVIFLVAAL